MMGETYVSPLLRLSAAVPAEGVDNGVAGHYGNPMIEQRRLENGQAVVDCSNRGVVVVTGPDRLTWLHSMVSQACDRLAPGDSIELLLLGAAGRVEHAAHAVDDGESTWLIAERSAAAPLVAFLDRMRFMMRVEVRDASAEFAVLGAMSVEALEAATAAAAPAGVALDWVDPWNTPSARGHQYAATAGHPGDRWHFIERVIPRAALADVLDAVVSERASISGSLALEALRIAAWRPRFATEVDEKTIPHELDWLRSAVDLGKGCYKGQETVAKVLNLGRPPRRLVLLHLDGSDTVLPAPNDVVIGEKVRPESVANESPERRTVGHITVSAMHHELGPIALAVVKRAVPGDLELIVESHGTDVAAAQTEIVPAEARSAVDVPRLPRLGKRP